MDIKSKEMYKYIVAAHRLLSCLFSNYGLHPFARGSPEGVVMVIACGH